MAIQPKRKYNNGLFEVQEIYSDKGMKILDKSNGYSYDNYEDAPITVPTSRIDECFETTEPVKEREPLPSENASEENNSKNN